jgi:hypothetical protein
MHALAEAGKRRRAAESRACEDISTEALEANVVAEMLAGLKLARAWMGQSIGLPDGYAAIEQIDATIAKTRAP